MAGNGISDLLPTMPPAIINHTTGWFINTTPSPTYLADVRILGGTDPTYGTQGWVPGQNGLPFAILCVEGSKEDETKEPNRIWVTYDVRLFVAIVHADTAAASPADYHQQAMLWLDSARQFVAGNRRVGAAGQQQFGYAGDSRWRMLGGNKVKRYDVLGVPYFGVEIRTDMRLVVLVNYQL